MNNRPKVKGFGQVMAFIKAGKEDVNWRGDGSLLAAGVLGHSLGTRASTAHQVGGVSRPSGPPGW